MRPAPLFLRLSVLHPLGQAVGMAPMCLRLKRGVIWPHQLHSKIDVLGPAYFLEGHSPSWSIKILFFDVRIFLISFLDFVLLTRGHND